MRAEDLNEEGGDEMMINGFETLLETNVSLICSGGEFCEFGLQRAKRELGEFNPGVGWKARRLY